MPSPTSSLATLRPDLGGSMEEFDLAADRAGFIGHRVAPILESAKQSGTFGKIPVEQLLQSPETRRAPGAGYGRGNWKFETASFATEEHGIEEPVDDREAQMYREYFDAEMVASQRAFDAVLRNHEIRWADKIFNATTWTGADLTTGVTNEWDDGANATPIADVEAAVKKVWEGCGLWPNALVINRRVFRNLRNCDEIIDRIKYQGFVDVRPERITVEALAAVFDLPYIIVSGSAKNTSAQPGLSLSALWSDEYAMVCRVAETNDIREPCIARTIHWAEDGSQIGGTVETYRDETRRSNIVRVRHDVDEIVMYPQCGHLLSNITT